MKQILLPTDFSENAKQAYPYAMKVAAKTGSKVTFLLAIDEPYDFAVRAEEKMEDAIAYARTHFNELIKKYGDMPDTSEVEIDFRIVHSKTGTGILKGIRDTQADWVVMGTKGTSGLKKLFFGSNASHIVSESPIPVLVIPNQSQFDGFEKIIFATEYREKDLDLIRSIAGFASIWDASIQVLHISKENDLESDLIQKGFEKKIDEQINYPKLECAVEYASDFFEGIRNYQHPKICSLLVMGRYELGFVNEILDYSETKAMSFYSKTPLLVLPVTDE